MNKKARIICKTCQKPAFVSLRDEEEKYFEKHQGQWPWFAYCYLNCNRCAWKYWSPKIASGEIDLKCKSPEFRNNYLEMKKKYANSIRTMS